MADMIDAIAARQMGVAPAAAQTAAGAPAAPAAPVPPQAPPQPPKEQQKDTAQDKAAAAGSPKDEADAMQAEAVMYEVDFGDGKKRKLTPEQIRATYDRYASMNYEHSQMKPVLETAKALMGHYKVDPVQFAQAMIEQAKKGGQGPTTFGDTSRQNGPETTAQSPEAMDFETKLKKWEEDNAASLPPGYKEMMQQQRQMQQMFVQSQQMLQQVLAGQKGVADAARATSQSATQQRVQAVQQQINNNLDRAQLQLQLPDAAAQDFLIFAAERGHNYEDFIDPEHTVRVMSDFKATMATPEMERLRAMAQRRQAFTGSLGVTPMGGNGPATPQGESTFDKLANSAMSKRMI